MCVNLDVLFLFPRMITKQWRVDVHMILCLHLLDAQMPRFHFFLRNWRRQLSSHLVLLVGLQFHFTFLGLASSIAHSVCCNAYLVVTLPVVCFRHACPLRGGWCTAKTLSHSWQAHCTDCSFPPIHSERKSRENVFLLSLLTAVRKLFCTYAFRPIVWACNLRCVIKENRFTFLMGLTLIAMVYEAVCMNIFSKLKQGKLRKISKCFLWGLP